MPSRREQIRMSEAEVAFFLSTRTRIAVATIGSDGMPHVVPMNFGVDRRGRIVVTAFARSQKVVNLERDPRATLMADSGARYHELAGVMIRADAEVVRTPDEVRRLMSFIRADAELTVRAGSAMAAQVSASLAKRVVIAFTPSRVVSWDHSKLGDGY